MTQFVRILKTLIRPYDVTLIYASMPNAVKYKWVLLRKGSQIQINDKTIIEFGSRGI